MAFTTRKGYLYQLNAWKDGLAPLRCPTREYKVGQREYQFSHYQRSDSGDRKIRWRRISSPKDEGLTKGVRSETQEEELELLEGESLMYSTHAVLRQDGMLAIEQNRTCGSSTAFVNHLQVAHGVKTFDPQPVIDEEALKAAWLLGNSQFVR